ncbi:MAG: alcohol dehydrogenase [Bacillaceae bacterium G1]|nr:alcohol dehydrogenase [Bacillota bacterium]OJF17070.1 MAG: alcohol dehydrogenase [Bacillaceae bacterium G1]
MRAIRFHEYGEPEVLRLELVETPTPGPQQVLIRVRAAGVNYADVMRRRNMYVQHTPLPFIPGSEVAGEVVAVGPGVRSFKEGDRVVTLLGPKCSGYAEYTIGYEPMLIPIPEGLDMVQAAALPLQGLTAYHILKTSAKVLPGETVLVHAAAGGVGTLAVQLAKIFGAKVIATASTEEKLALARSLGADHTVNYTSPDWDKQVLELTNGAGVDVILEMVGGEVFRKNLGILAEFGRMVVFGAASKERATLEPFRLMNKCQSVIGFLLTPVVRRPELYWPSLNELLQLVKDGRLKLQIGGTYPLEQAALVHRLLEGRQTTGKLVLVP